jgi:cellulose synthase/poly-beta-1,6-N-acetylglucosamine synthase-like glycosyltransferase
MKILWSLLASLFILATLPGTLELVFLSLSGILPRRENGNQGSTSIRCLRLCVIVPAHNEEYGIGACVASLLAGDACRHEVTVVVVADNCTDSTARLARTAGVRVIERADPLLRGKGYALDYAFSILLSEGFDVFLIVDADTKVETNFIPVMGERFAQGAEALQCRYLVSNAEESLHARLMHLAWVAFNILRLRGRERWGLSVGILGNGFGLARSTLERVPYTAFSIAEDLEYHLHLVRAGLRVGYCDETTVWSDVPVHGQAAAKQVARWDGGRFRLIREQTPGLALEVLKGRLNLLEPLLDLLLLPLVFHVSLLLCLLAIPSPVGRLLAAVGFSGVAFHVFAAMYLEQRGWRDAWVLLYVPFYMLWKLSQMQRIFSFARSLAVWERTDRGKKA